jgi:hypothetical protein
MWTIVRFSLAATQGHSCPAALDLLRRDGFSIRLVPAPGGDDGGALGETSYGVVAGDVQPDTALVSHRVFIALQAAGFSPVMVSARHADRGEPFVPAPWAPSQASSASR